MKYITGLVNERNAIFGRPYLHDEYNADKDPNGWQADYWWGYGLGRSHWHIRPIPDTYGGASTEGSIRSQFFWDWAGKHPQLPSFLPLFQAAWYDEDDGDSALFIPGFRFKSPKDALQLAIRLKQVSLKSMSTTDGKTKLATDTLRRQADCTGPYVTQFKSEFEKMSFWVGDWDVTGTRDGSSLTNYYKSTNSSESVPFRLPAEVRGHSTTAAEFPGFVLLYGRKNGVPSGYVYLTSVHNYGLSGFLRFWQGCGTTSSSSYPIERSIGLGRNYWGLDENGNETEVSSDILRWGQWTSYSAGDISFDVWEQDYYCTGWSTTAQKKRAAVKLSGMFGQLIFTLF